MIKNILLVGIGGGVGSMTRYLLSHYIHKNLQFAIPYATFFINITGSLLIGVLLGYFGKNINISPEYKLLAIVGFCGGYTTFSTFSAENFQYLQQGQYWSAILYSISSVVLGIIAMTIGWMIAK